MESVESGDVEVASCSVVLLLVGLVIFVVGVDSVAGSEEVVVDVVVAVVVVVLGGDTGCSLGTSGRNVLNKFSTCFAI